METIKETEISKEVQRSYIDYAMSVIISRALPDVRDGLKPVQRRILYSMFRLGLKHSARYRKSATVVGDVLGKYHPHGDIPVYDALARMAQYFVLRYPLIDGQGNFGSIDGDAPAAMRYTEVRLTPLAEAMMEDIDKETVQWADNYDRTRKEPMYLPASIPQLLINGSKGIAVGMATNIPPHNLGEVIDALIFLIDHPGASVEELVEKIKGPDFPTGGIIFDRNRIIEAYSTGKGSIPVRAKTEISEEKREIIISDIVWQVNKANLIKHIAELVKEGKIEGIKDIKDQSQKQEIKIVIKVKNLASPRKILNQLFKYTDLQKSFNLIMLALVDGIKPRVLSLKEMLAEYLSHRKKVIRRKTEFELRKAQERLHILQGLIKALDIIDEIIQEIKKSKNKAWAKKALVKKFGFSEVQAEAILETKIHQLAAMEQEEVRREYKEKQQLIEKLRKILANPQEIIEIIKKQLEEIKQKFSDPRKTKIIKAPLREIQPADTIQKEQAIITFTKQGEVKRLSPRTYHQQKRGGIGILGAKVGDNDQVISIIRAFTTDGLLVFTQEGKVFKIKVHQIPEKKRQQKGEPLSFLVKLEPESDRVVALLPVPEDTNKKFFVFLTQSGKIKKTPLAMFKNITRAGVKAIKIANKDKLEAVKLLEEESDIFLVTRQGKVLRTNLESIKPQGKYAQGVKGIKLRKGDKTAALVGISQKGKAKLSLLTVTEKGFAKKTPISKFRSQKRGGSGIKCAKITSRTGELVEAMAVQNKEEGELIIISNKGKVLRTSIKSIPSLGRTTQGVKVLKLKEGDKLASLAQINE